MTLRKGGEWAEEVAYAVSHGIPVSEFRQWPVADQEVALAYEREQKLRCGVCGTAHWMFESDPDAYMAENERCRGCQKLAKQQRLNQSYDGDMDGIRVVLVPKEFAVGVE